MYFLLKRRALRVARYAAVAGLLAMLSACLGTPDGVMPVQDFDAERYLGRWYEIARLDHSFERDLSNVTAEYAWREDGAVRVVNRGYDTKDQQWNDIEGQARFVGPQNEGHLKVSFFGPFYASYVVFDLDRENYNHAFVSGFNRDYLWLLARTPSVPEAVRTKFLEQASALGFDTEDVIWVEHSPVDGGE